MKKESFLLKVYMKHTNFLFKTTTVPLERKITQSARQTTVLFSSDC